MPDAEMSKSMLSYIFSHQVILENFIKKLEFVGEEMKYYQFIVKYSVW